jgi:hypothetical protein
VCLIIKFTIGPCERSTDSGRRYWKLSRIEGRKHLPLHLAKSEKQQAFLSKKKEIKHVKIIQEPTIYP